MILGRATSRKYLFICAMRLFRSMSELGYSIGYQYDHDYPQAVSYQSFLPEGYEEGRYYQPSDNGYEVKVKAWLDEVKRLRIAGKGKLEPK